MHALILPGKQCDRFDFELIQYVSGEASSLEGLISGVLESPSRRLTFISITEDGAELLLGIVRFQNGSEVFVSMPRVDALRGRKIFNPADGVKQLADSTKAVIDEEWVKERDAAYGIRTWPTHYETEAGVRPSRAVDLILSYAFSPYGEAKLSRELYDAEHYRCGVEGIHLELSHLGEEDAPGLGERLWVNWTKFAELAARRSGKQVASSTRGLRMRTRSSTAS